MFFTKEGKKKGDPSRVSRRVILGRCSFAPTMMFTHSGRNRRRHTKVGQLFSASHAIDGAFLENHTTLRTMRFIKHTFVRCASAIGAEVQLDIQASPTLFTPSAFLCEIRQLFHLFSTLRAKEMIRFDTRSAVWAVAPHFSCHLYRLVGNIGLIRVVRRVVFPHGSVLLLV